MVFISRGGRVVLHKAYGYRDVESRAPMQRDDVFRIASQSKAITSLAVMMLWEEGHFQLDDPVSRYLPEFARANVLKTFNAADSTYTEERARRLVALHDGESGKAVPMRKDAFDGVSPNFPTLKGTYFSGGAGLSSTVEDYARFLQLFLNKGEFNGVRLLSPKTVEWIMTEQTPRIDAEVGLAFGLETADNDHQAPRSLGSFSWAGAFATLYWADPKEQLIGQIYTNMLNPPARGLGGRFEALTYAALVKPGT